MKTVVFVRRGPLFRIYNQAYALKKSGKYNLIFICQTVSDENTLKLFSKVFDKIILYHPLDFKYYLGRKKSAFHYLMKHLLLYFVDSRFRSLSEKIKLPTILDEIDADVFNCLIRPYELSYQVISNVNVPVVWDAYDFDGLMHGIENISSAIRNREKYYFENAGGFIFHSSNDEIDYFKDGGYSMDHPCLPWLDCCNKEFFADDGRKLSDEDGKCHIVQIGGGISSAHVSLVGKLIKQGIHYHIYPTPATMSPLVYKNFLKMDASEKYFHFENSVPFDEINQEIAKYDFGVHFHLTYLHPMGFKFVHSHKFFSYLESGLPIIVSDCLEHIKKTVVDNGVGFSIGNNEFDSLHDKIQSYDYSELKSNVLDARKKYLIDNHADKLVGFYDKVTGDGIDG